MPFGSLGSSEDKPQDLEQQFTQSMTEVHSVVPGVFALFGFQLIAAFNDVFSKELNALDKGLYVAALSFLAISAALLMTPASYHRQVRPHSVSPAFTNLISRLIAWAMAPLTVVFPVDAYLVGKVATKSTAAGLAIGVLMLTVFASAWFLYPAVAKRRNHARRVKARQAGAAPQPV